MLKYEVFMVSLRFLCASFLFVFCSFAGAMEQGAAPITPSFTQVPRVTSAQISAGVICKRSIESSNNPAIKASYIALIDESELGLCKRVWQENIESAVNLLFQSAKNKVCPLHIVSWFSSVGVMPKEHRYLSNIFDEHKASAASFHSVLYIPRACFCIEMATCTFFKKNQFASFATYKKDLSTLNSKESTFDTILGCADALEREIGGTLGDCAYSKVPISAMRVLSGARTRLINARKAMEKLLDELESSEDVKISELIIHEFLCGPESVLSVSPKKFLMALQDLFQALHVGWSLVVLCENMHKDGVIVCCCNDYTKIICQKFVEEMSYEVTAVQQQAPALGHEIWHTLTRLKNKIDHNLYSCSNPACAHRACFLCPCLACHYCCESCQRAHWLTHRPHCPKRKILPAPVVTTTTTTAFTSVSAVATEAIKN